MKILTIGDVFGKPGRKTLEKVLPQLITEKSIDFVIANAENAHHGKGVTDSKIKEMKSYGVDFFTSGNHIWKVPEIYAYLDQENYPLIRPANYPKNVPGRGYQVMESKKGDKIAIINIMGRVFMPGSLDDPFLTVENIIKELSNQNLVLGENLKAIIVDMHAEASSEKLSLAYFLDGKISLFYGTHTHVPTADEQILPKGTGYITDLGMTGVINSIIGARKEEIIQGFITQMPVKHEVAEGETVFNGLITEIGDNGLAKNIERIQIKPISV